MTSPDDRDAIAGLRSLGESIGIRIENPTLIGVQGNTFGIRSDVALWSGRTDSRTFFLQDRDFGPNGRRGLFEGSADQLIDTTHTVLDRLGIPSGERIHTRVITEQTCAASYDSETNRFDLEAPEDGIRYAEITRAVETFPVWHSKALVALDADGRPGFLHVHWPELSDEILGEAARFADAIKGDWIAPKVEAAHPVSSEAGILHSLAVGFVMEAVAAVRVIYTADNPRAGRKPLRYVTPDGRDVPPPRDHLWHLDEGATPSRGRYQSRAQADL